MLDFISDEFPGADSGVYLASVAYSAREVKAPQEIDAAGGGIDECSREV